VLRELLDQDHYEVLEAKRGASPREIDRAYRVVRSAYEGESIALYSVYGEAEAGMILEQIDEAYQVLSDESARKAYDRLLDDKRAAEVESLPAESSLEEVSQADDFRDDETHMDFRENQMEAGDEEISGSPSAEITEFDGSSLRRARLRAGVELKEISDITKVSMTNLQNIEDEEFEGLPASVYIRGFVMAYANMLGLDAEKVATDYMARVEINRVDQSRSRFLGRR
jgi:flagellar biosynthesis protein FlhG